jgi:translation initiation factor IF-2
VWPDSFPERQGQSKNEYSAKGGVVIYMNEYLNDTIRNWYKNFEIKPFANSIDEYVGLVTEMINNLEKREKLSEFNKNIFFNQTTNFIKCLNE